MNGIFSRHKSYAGLCALPLLLALGACSGSDGQESEPKRGPVAITSAEVTNNVINLVVASCNGNPVANMSETDSGVKVTVTADIQREGEACLDALDVPLDVDLGELPIITFSSDTELLVSSS